MTLELVDEPDLRLTEPFVLIVVPDDEPPPPPPLPPPPVPMLLPVSPRAKKSDLIKPL
jgi:hypothetical protein